MVDWEKLLKKIVKMKVEVIDMPPMKRLATLNGGMCGASFVVKKKQK